PTASRLTGHPLLGECVADGPDEWLYVAAERPADLWVLDDHRTVDGSAVLPGTAYLEMARAAYQDVAGTRPAELRDVAFLAPLAVGDDEARRIEVALTRRSDG